MLLEYAYFVKCPDCEDERFEAFDDAKSCAMGCLSKKPVITQVEICRNDFGECTDSTDLGQIWSWEDTMRDIPTEPELTTFKKSETLDCEDDFFNCEFDDDFSELDSVPDNYERPNTQNVITESSEGYGALFFEDDEVVSKDEVAEAVAAGKEVIINLGYGWESDPTDIRFDDGGIYSDSEIRMYGFQDDWYHLDLWHTSDDGGNAEGDYAETFRTFDALWDAAVTNFIGDRAVSGSLAEGISDSTRAPQDTDFVVVSKHPQRNTYSFLGNNYRMTKQLDKAMPYSSKEEAEYDIQYAEDASMASGANYDNYTSDQFFVVPYAEAKTMVSELSDQVQQRAIKTAERSALTDEVRQLAIDMYNQGTQCDTWEEFEAFMLANDYPQPSKHLYYNTYRAELKKLRGKANKTAKRPIPADMTIESLIEEMEENEDMVECKVCEELVEKTHCHKDPKRGWVCEACGASTLTEAKKAPKGSASYYVYKGTWPDGDVVLEYDDLYVEFGAGPMVGGWDSPPEPRDWIEDRVQHTFYVDTEDVANIIFEDCLTDEDIAGVAPGLDVLAKDDELYAKFFEEHFGDLVEKYQGYLLSYYEEDAADDYIENNAADYDDGPDPDWAYDSWRDSQLDEDTSKKAIRETLPEHDDPIKAKMTMCPECGIEEAYDHVGGFCTSCGFGSN